MKITDNTTMNKTEEENEWNLIESYLTKCAAGRLTPSSDPGDYKNNE